MASGNNIEIRTTEYRPCYVTEAVAYSEGVPVVKHERKALFHRWAEKHNAFIKNARTTVSYLAEDLEFVKHEYDQKGYLYPGFDVDLVRCTVAIVEFEDGNVAEVEPSAVRFVPGLMNEYDFMEAVNETRT